MPSRQLVSLWKSRSGFPGPPFCVSEAEELTVAAQRPVHCRARARALYRHSRATQLNQTPGASGSVAPG